jgi:DNA helicase-2/ATP-dependent DNA helicase PcrA
MSLTLNAQQQAAVKHASGPLLIVAGAGTGKTTVITERIKFVIGKKKVSPNEILALTFTEKAATEMFTRLDEVMPLGYEEPWLSTFHAFCDRLLRLEGLEIGLSPDYEILNQPKQWLLVKQHLFDLGLDYYRPLGNPTKFIGALLTFFSRLQDENIDPAGFERFVKKTTKAKDETKRLKELSQAYRSFQELKVEENQLDFGDLITWTVKLFTKRPSVLKKYQQQFKHILVDEFQDTNFSQLQLIKLLAPAAQNPNLVVVGDDDQSIYKWRGASISNILDFKKHYPKAKEVVLTKNYRSGQRLLNTAYKLIQHNNPDRLEMRLKINKKLVSQRKERLSEPQVVVLPSLEAEADFVAGTILELAAKKPYTYKDFAVLARANNHLEPFVAALKRASIPYQLLGNRGLFDQDEVRSLLFFLKVVVDPTDTPSLFQLLHTSVLRVEPDLLLEMLTLAKQERKTLWQVVEESRSGHSGLELLVAQVAQARQRAVKEPASPILYDFIETSHYIEEFLEPESVANQLKLKNVNLFFDQLKRFEGDHKNSTLVEGVEYLDLLMEAGENPAQAEIEDIDTVSLLTVHSAKGLEFPVVFVVNLVADRFPTRQRHDPIEIPETLVKETLPQGDYHLQEERRLFYVALTRAKDLSLVTAGKDYGGAREKKLSGFVKELGVEIETIQEPTTKQLSWLEVPKPEAEAKLSRLIGGRLQLDFVSYSQLDLFQTCPLKYKYRYILQVPVRPHHALTFGQSIHNTLRDFHRFQQQGQKPDKKTLLHLYEKHFVPFGYESEEHKHKRFDSGKKALNAYFDLYQNQFSGKPYWLEKSFRINIADTWLIGKIDRIDKLANGAYELIDYKTGSVKSQQEVDKDVQLTIYKLAAQTAFGIKAQTLALYFLEGNQKLVTRRTLDQLEAKKEDIAQTIAQIRTSTFAATPGYPFPCGYCAYNQICPFAKKS